jgi:hypothetical protein
MQARGKVFDNWTATQTAEEAYAETLENGCFIDVRVREIPPTAVHLLVSVYAADGTAVYEHVSTLQVREWNVQDALQRGIDQAERIAGGEGGRLRCADGDRPLARK